MSDAINPTHYKGVTINGVEVQCIDVIELLDLGFHLGNALKYAWRLGRKHDRIDEEINKCLWYLDRWRDRDYERIDLRSPDPAARRRVEVAGYLHTMCTAWRVRDAVREKAGPVWMTTSEPWMQEMIELLGIEREIVAYVKKA
jgi:hypothetical protein